MKYDMFARMSKSDLIDTLLESAIKIFAREGYDGASLREIALDADVTLSTINLYFGNKSDLFNAVVKTVWAEIDRERTTLFVAARERNLPDPVPLTELIYSLAFPIVLHVLSENELELAKIKLLTGNALKLEMIGRMRETANRSVIQWIEAMTLTCPSLSKQDIIWTFSFCVGVIYSWQLINHRYDGLFEQDRTPSPARITDDIVAFACAGVEAIVKRRSEQSV
jgi:AcrR family transcriptional regulator